MQSSVPKAVCPNFLAVLTRGCIQGCKVKLPLPATLQTINRGDRFRVVLVPAATMSLESIHAQLTLCLRWPAANLPPFRAVLVGHSLGGPIIAQTAADDPDLVAALVIVAGSLDPAQESVPFIQYVGDTWPVSALLPRMLRNANREIIALEPQLEALAPRLAAIKVPVTIVHGTKDDLVPFANVAFIKTHMTGTKAMDVTVLDGKNHFLPWNSKDKVEAAIAKAFAMMDVP